MLSKNQEQQGINTMAKFETDENVRERNLNHTDEEDDTVSEDNHSLHQTDFQICLSFQVHVGKG